MNTPKDGATVNFSFSGSVTGASIGRVTETATGAKIDVNDTPVDVLAEKLNSGEWVISLGDFLYENNRDSEIELTDFEPESDEESSEESAEGRMANVEHQADAARGS